MPAHPKNSIDTLCTVLTIHRGNIRSAAQALGITRESITQRARHNARLRAAIATARANAVAIPCPACEGTGQERKEGK